MVLFSEFIILCILNVLVFQNKKKKKNKHVREQNIHRYKLLKSQILLLKQVMYSTKFYLLQTQYMLDQLTDLQRKVQLILPMNLLLLTQSLLPFHFSLLFFF